MLWLLAEMVLINVIFTKDLHNKDSACCLERCQSILSPKSLKQLFPTLIDSYFSETFMLIMSPGFILCNVNTKFYAKESQGGHSADFSLASPPTASWNKFNKESRTVGGVEPRLSSMPFFYLFRYLSSPVKKAKISKHGRECILL